MIGNITLILSALTFVLICISLCVGTRRKSLKFQTLSCLTEATYNILNMSLTAAVMSGICWIRSIVYSRKSHYSKMTYRLILVLFIALIIGGCFVTWSGPVSLLLLPGSLLRTYSLWQSKMRLIRWSGAVSGLLGAIYYMCYGAWFIVAGYLLMFAVGAYEYYIKDIKGARKRSKYASAYHRRLCYQEVED